MSHAKERKEKNCLNCNAVVAGRFCGVCGQENIETGETFGHLAGHFVSDIFHFDGQFFSTAKYLLFKPGFLTYEYARGRRASYLNPIKMYFFVSAVFFLFFLSAYKPAVKFDGDTEKNLTAKETVQYLTGIKEGLNKMMLDGTIPDASKGVVKQKLDLVTKNLAILQRDTTRKKELLREVNTIQLSNFGAVAVDDSGDYRSVEEYDSLQERLPEAKRDGWLKHRYQTKMTEMAGGFRKDPNEAFNLLLENLFHRFPQVLFISLPLFALVLSALYGRKKGVQFSHHAIYTVHLYCALFVFLFAMLVLYKMAGFEWLGWLKWVFYAVFLYAVYYTWQALHVYYGQGWVKTTVKWMILNVAAFFVMLLLFVLLVFFTVFTM